MKSFWELIDFKYFLGTKQIWLYAYVAVYLLYALTSGIRDPLLAVSIIIFAFAPLRPAFLMFVFYLLWEYVTTFSFGLTAVLTMQVIMIIKIFVQGKGVFKSKTLLQKKALSLQTALLIYIAIMGLASFVLYQGFTGIGFIFKIVATFYVISFMDDEDSASRAIQSMFHILMISSLVATIYGFFHKTGVERWIAEMGDYVTQFYGTVGTTRMALFYLVGMAYFLYYVKNVVLKYAGLLLFTVLVLMTVSLTALILYVVVVLIYIYSLGKLRKGLLYLLIVAVLAVASFPIWSSSSYVKPLLYRISYSMDSYEQGDVNAALSGRENLAEYYTNAFEESNMATKILGNARSAMSATGNDMNSHNTYIDILFFFGILGLVLLALYQIKKVRLIWGQSYFFPLLSLKVIFLLGAASVSIMSSTYFIFLIFI